MRKKESWLSSRYSGTAASVPTGKKVITPILDASTFYPVQGEESYHQDYYKNSPILYKYYRYSCGRDNRLKEIWGDKAGH